VGVVNSLRNVHSLKGDQKVSKKLYDVILYDMYDAYR